MDRGDATAFISWTPLPSNRALNEWPLSGASSPTATAGDAVQTDTCVRRPTARPLRERLLFLPGKDRPEHGEGIIERAVAVLKDGGERTENHEAVGGRRRGEIRSHSPPQGTLIPAHGVGQQISEDEPAVSVTTRDHLHQIGDETGKGARGADAHPVLRWALPAQAREDGVLQVQDAAPRPAVERDRIGSSLQCRNRGVGRVSRNPQPLGQWPDNGLAGRGKGPGVRLRGVPVGRRCGHDQHSREVSEGNEGSRLRNGGNDDVTGTRGQAGVWRACNESMHCSQSDTVRRPRTVAPTSAAAPFVQRPAS